MHIPKDWEKKVEELVGKQDRLLHFKTKTGAQKAGAILSFLFENLPPVVKRMMEESGCSVKPEREGLQLCFQIEAGQLGAVFFFGNLYLEIVTKDRDAEPLEFDRRLEDFDFFARKVAVAVRGKVAVLQKVLKKGNLEQKMDEVWKLASDYQRLKILKLDLEQRKEKENGSS